MDTKGVTSGIKKRMKLRCVGVGGNKNIEKGEIVVVKEIHEGIKSIEFEGKSGEYYAEYFEPVNNKKVGDKVLYDKYCKATIFGIADIVDILGKKYAISYTHPIGNYFNRVVDEKSLSEPLNKNKLEVGDVCKQKGGNRIRILCKANDEYSNKITYFVRNLEGELKGSTNVLLAKEIEEKI